MLTQEGCAGRLARLRQYMQQEKLDAALISDRHEVYYFTGAMPQWTAHIQPVLLWVTQDEALAFALEQDASIKAVVSMPTGHNPLGCVMPDAHKQRLVQLCEAHGIALIEDDIYGDMGGDVPYRAAKAFDRSGHVIYCHSLNKLLAPGFRLGWLIAGRWQARVEMLKYANTRYNEELPQMVAAHWWHSAPRAAPVVQIGWGQLHD